MSLKETTRSFDPVQQKVDALLEDEVVRDFMSEYALDIIGELADKGLDVVVALYTVLVQIQMVSKSINGVRFPSRSMRSPNSESDDYQMFRENIIAKGHMTAAAISYLNTEAYLRKNSPVEIITKLDEFSTFLATIMFQLQLEYFQKVNIATTQQY